eukprot:jgi/Undpi1/2036/HiC_scaffold_12.g05422.m1
MRGVALPVLRSSLRAPSSKIGGRFGRATWTTQQLGKTAPLATVSSLGIDKATGIKNPVFEHEVKHKEGEVTSNGTFCVSTGQFTGRSPKDKHFVKQARHGEMLSSCASCMK